MFEGRVRESAHQKDRASNQLHGESARFTVCSLPFLTSHQVASAPLSISFYIYACGTSVCGPWWIYNKKGLFDKCLTGHIRKPRTTAHLQSEAQDLFQAEFFPDKKQKWKNMMNWCNLTLPSFLHSQLHQISDRFTGRALWPELPPRGKSQFGQGSASWQRIALEMLIQCRHKPSFILSKWRVGARHYCMQPRLRMSEPLL